MDITYEQYQQALQIVQAYEEHLRNEEQQFDDDDEWGEERDWEEEEAEAEAERRMEIACLCTCGAWVVNKNGEAVHVADCYCGAE